MPYAKLLSDLINNCELSIKEIAERCKEYDVDISASYISMLKNQRNNKIPSDDVSKALAKVCGAEYEDSLILEAYIDKAPDEMQKFFFQFRRSIIDGINFAFKDKYPQDQLDLLNDHLENMYLSNLMVESTKVFPDENSSDSIINNNNFKELFVNPKREGIEVSDDEMAPSIPKGCRVDIISKDLSEYRDGDILVVITKRQKMIVRKCIFPDNERKYIYLFGTNQDADVQKFSINEIDIQGAVVEIIIAV